MKPNRDILIFCALGLAGCGSDSAAPAPQQHLTEPPPDAVAVSGRATKGPVSEASVSLFAIDGRGEPSGDAIATTRTDVAGNWSFSLAADHPAYLIAVSGGHFVDESDADTLSPRVIELRDDETLLSILPAGEQSAAVTLFTHALVEKSRREVSNNDFLDLVVGNQAQYGAALGVDPLLTRSADPLAPVGSAAEQRYALLAGGAAYALNAVAISRGQASADFELIELFARDLVDCEFDGRGVGGQVLYDFAPLGERTLNDDILRFRNNHFAAYQGVAIPNLPQTGCPATPGTADTTAPVFTSVAAPLLVAAQNADGIAAAATVIQVALNEFAVSDDRDSAPSLEALLPDMVALGVNEIVVVATDDWGNRQEIVWVIDVRDLSPPAITAPPDKTVAATGDLTLVDLGQPQFSDDVSAGAALNVSNNAPAGGFAIGAHVIVWTVVDEAGLAASAEQRVFVSGGAPLLLQDLGTLVATEGAEVAFDLGDFFADPILAPLQFSIAGLPVESGITLDVGSGRVRGAPSAVDLLAQPLNLDVVVSNGVFEISVPWTLAIQPAIPAFSLSESLLGLDEDFVGSVSVEAIPLAAPLASGTIEFALTQVGGDGDILASSIDMQSGQVTLAAIANRNGSALFAVTASNSQNGASFSEQLRVDVIAVNDPPEAIGTLDEVTVIADEFFELALAELIRDVDDATLEYRLEGSPPRGYAVADAALSGVASAVAATGGVFRTVVVATDDAGLSGSANLDIRVLERDTDGDGLSDVRELALGTDAAQIDSDDDGVDDGVEIAAGSDPLLAATRVVYLSASGSDTNGGSNFDDALRSHDAITSLPPGQSAAQPTFVLYAGGTDARYGGALQLDAPCDNIVLAGSIDETVGVTRLAQSGAPSSHLTAVSATPVSLQNCNNVTLVNLAIVDNKETGLRVSGGDVRTFNVHINGNFSEGGAGGLAVSSARVMFAGGAISANESRGDGAGLEITGSGSDVVVRDAILSGNLARGDGGAVFVGSANGRLELFNNLIVANFAGRGGALYAADGIAVSSVNTTFAFNQHAEVGSGAAVAFAPAVPVSVTDSLLWSNLDAVLERSALPAGTASVFNIFDQAPLGAGDVSLPASGPAFGQGYALTSSTGGLDNGSVLATDAALDDRYAASGSPYPDEGALDRGYHYPFSRNADALTAEQLDADIDISRAPTVVFASYRRMKITPRLTTGRLLGPGYRVRIAPIGTRSILTNAVNIHPLAEEVQATDLGNGEYQVWIDVREVDHSHFRLTVDEVTIEVTTHDRCASPGCDPDQRSEPESFFVAPPPM